MGESRRSRSCKRASQRVGSSRQRDEQIQGQLERSDSRSRGSRSSSRSTTIDPIPNMVSCLESDSLEYAPGAARAATAPGQHDDQMEEDDDEERARAASPMELGEGRPRTPDEDQASTSSDTASRLKRQQQQHQQQSKRTGAHQDSRLGAAPLPPPPLPSQPAELIASLELDDELDEEQLKRILACKRLSEGNCGQHLAQVGPRLGALAAREFVCRKNSLHLIGESLPPVTEGEPMRHLSRHMSSANMEQGAACGSQTSVSSASLRSRRASLAGGGGGGRRGNSQDDNGGASCSSSTSLDGSASGSHSASGSGSGSGSGCGSGLRSPSRRRSSTVSQCSSVLSEGTRQQLNFDLSPDLAPDSSLLEANAISPVDFERPASPEPSSPGSSPFDTRPVSRMSGLFSCDEIMLTASPDSTLGDSNENTTTTTTTNHEHDDGNVELGNANRARRDQPNASETRTNEAAAAAAAANIRDNLERIISHVSTVRVGADALAHREEHTGAGQKRAHTPFGLNIQRNKATHMSPATPSPTAHLDQGPGGAAAAASAVAKLATCE